MGRGIWGDTKKHEKNVGITWGENTEGIRRMWDCNGTVLLPYFILPPTERGNAGSAFYSRISHVLLGSSCPLIHFSSLSTFFPLTFFSPRWFLQEVCFVGRAFSCVVSSIPPFPVSPPRFPVQVSHSPFAPCVMTRLDEFFLWKNDQIVHPTAQYLGVVSRQIADR